MGARPKILLVSCAVFLLLLAASPGRFFASDTTPRLTVARQLWSHLSVFVPPDNPRREGLLYIPQKNAWTSLYGIGQSLVLIPFDILGAGLAGLVPPGLDDHVDKLPIFFLYLPLVGTLWWLLMASTLAYFGFNGTRSARLALIFFASTIIWFYASQSTQEEALVAVLILGAFVTALKWKKEPRNGFAWVMGALVGGAVLVRMNALIGALPLIGVALEFWRTDKTRAALLPGAIARVLAGALPALFLLCAFAYARFGSPWATGYDIARLQAMGVFWGPFDWSCLMRLIAGPGKGLLLLSPPLFLALWGWVLWVRRQPYLAGSVLLCTVVSLALCSRILNNPDGSESWGTRYQVHLLSYWVVPFAIGWTSLQGRGRKGLGYAVVTIGALIQLASSWAPTAVEYIQVPQDGGHRRLITGSPTKGQLPLRLRNLFRWAQGRSIVSGEQADREALLYIERNYVPDFWGPVYSKKLQSVGILVIWLVLLLAAGGLFRAGLFYSRAGGPD